MKLLGRGSEPEPLSREAVEHDLNLVDRPANRLRHAVTWAAVGATALALGGWAYFGQYDDSSHYDPKHPGPDMIDGKLVVYSWNVHGRAAQSAPTLKRFARDADVIALQEATGDDEKVLEKSLPHLYLRYGPADRETHFFEGGQGNMLITAQPLKDTYTRHIAGTSLGKSALSGAKGIGEDVASVEPSFPHMWNGRQENREIMGGTLNEQNNGKTIPIDIATSQIAGHLNPKLHDRQFTKILNLLGDRTKTDVPAVFMGDLNAGNSEVIPAYSGIGYYVPNEARPTTAKSDKTIDHFATHYAGKLGLCVETVLGTYGSDHHAIRLECPVE